MTLVKAPAGSILKDDDAHSLAPLSFLLQYKSGGEL